ncbi:hypothetical protein HanRHA438_Chr13g0597301 [Helianthus annuus]|nr:hypothetical protein HanRHA438_Chr13g0597301 [Helianthus annuus]
MVSSSIPDPPGFYRPALSCPWADAGSGFPRNWWHGGLGAPCVQVGLPRATFRPMGAAYRVPGDSYVGRSNKNILKTTSVKLRKWCCKKWKKKSYVAKSEKKVRPRKTMFHSTKEVVFLKKKII